MDGAWHRGRTLAAGSVTHSLESHLFEVRTRRGGLTPPAARVRPPAPPVHRTLPYLVVAPWDSRGGVRRDCVGASGGRFCGRGCGGRRNHASSSEHTG